MNGSILEVELVLDARTELGEGPVWDHEIQRLLFVNIMRGAVHEFDPGTHMDSVTYLDRPVGAVMPTRRGDRVVAAQGGFFRFRPGDSSLSLITAVEAHDPDLRMNDGNCDSRGRFWAGSLSLSKRQHAASLYRLNPDGTVAQVLANVTTSNGIDWSPDDTLMYYIDTGKGMIDVFNFDSDSGDLMNRRPFAVIAREDGRPDGLTVDADGGVWVALWQGGAIRRYRRNGLLDLVIPMPVSCPTSCAFGGSDLCDLYITTARSVRPAESRAEPNAGALFRCRPGVVGRPVNRFAG